MPNLQFRIETQECLNTMRQLEPARHEWFNVQVGGTIGISDHCFSRAWSDLDPLMRAINYHFGSQHRRMRQAASGAVHAPDGPERIYSQYVIRKPKPLALP